MRAHRGQIELRREREQRRKEEEGQGSRPDINIPPFPDRPINRAKVLKL